MTSLFDQRNAPLATSITPFLFEGFAVRTIQINGEPWFVAADVCGVLDLGNVTMVLKRLDGDEQALISIEGISHGNDRVNVINESGLYNLILGSRKPSSKRFKRWVTGEVLPTIRKTGGYGQPAALSTMDILTLAMESEKGRLPPHVEVGKAVVHQAQLEHSMPPSLDAPVRPATGTSADSLESHIKHLGAQMMAAYARYEASGCFSDIGEAHAYRIQMQRAISQRSPAQVKQLEIERGLS